MRGVERCYTVRRPNKYANRRGWYDVRLQVMEWRYVRGQRQLSVLKRRQRNVAVLRLELIAGIAERRDGSPRLRQHKSRGAFVQGRTPQALQ